MSRARQSWSTRTRKRWVNDRAAGRTYKTQNTVVVEHKGDDPIGLGEKAMQGIQRHAAVSFGRW